MSHDHEMIRFNVTLIEKRVNLNLNGMRVIEKVYFLYTHYLYLMARVISLEKVWNNLEDWVIIKKM